jgi:hypothetical protein
MINLLKSREKSAFSEKSKRGGGGREGVKCAMKFFFW